jgi:flagellar basal body rod protein FlgC
LLQAKNSYQANLATIKIADAMQKSALSLTDPNARARNPG